MVKRWQTFITAGGGGGRIIQQERGVALAEVSRVTTNSSPLPAGNIFYLLIVAFIFSSLLSFLDELEECLSLGIVLLLNRCLLIALLVFDLLIDVASDNDSIAIDTVSQALIFAIRGEQVRLCQPLHHTDLVPRLIVGLLQALRLFLSFHSLQA